MDELPPEAVYHLIKAFAHHTGLGVHPGKYRGPEVKNPFSIRRRDEGYTVRKELVTLDHFVMVRSHARQPSSPRAD